MVGFRGFPPLFKKNIRNYPDIGHDSFISSNPFQFIQTAQHLMPHKMHYLRLHQQKRLQEQKFLNPLNPELNPICYLLALLAHHFLHVSRIRVKSLTIRLLTSYIYMERLFLMFLDHTQRRTTVGRTPLDE